MTGHVEVISDDEGIATITLNRSDRLNALTWPMMDDLRAALRAIAADPSVRVVILTGAGRGFCAGLDIREDNPTGVASTVEYVYENQERVASLALALRDLAQPVIAAVNGPAAGGGMAIALACDVRLCAEEAVFANGFVRIGLSACDVGLSYLLPRLVGAGLASELMLTGRQVGAEEAQRIGLANRVVPQEDLLVEARAMALQITANSPFGVRMTKQVLRRNLDAGSLEAAIELENRTQVVAARTRNSEEALAAFLERRDPTFT